MDGERRTPRGGHAERRSAAWRRGESAGVWLGNGSVAAGLSGEVSGDELRRLFDGAHPLTGEPLGRAYVVREGADRVTGWDLTFSAPKSVSTLWAVGGGAVGIEV